MKKIFSIVCLFSALCILSSCHKEQTGLSVDSIPGRATIIGTLYFQNGTIGTTDTTVPAADVDVIVRISNHDYNSSSSGYTEFKSKTTNEGKYEIEFPVPSDGLRSVQVKVPDMVKKNGSKESVFSFSSSESNLTPGDIRIVDGIIKEKLIY